MPIEKGNDGSWLLSKSEEPQISFGLGPVKPEQDAPASPRYLSVQE